MSKKAIEIIASEESYRNLATFTDIKQLNDTVRQYKRQYADQLTNTAVKVLDTLHRYSAKYTGVSFMAKNTIAELIGVSRRTIIRVCQLLESLGIVKQYEMKRSSDKKQTSNAIVIQAIDKGVAGDVFNDNLAKHEGIVTQDTADNVTPLKQRLSKTNKQEKNNNISDIEIDNITPIDKIVRYVAYKITDAEKRNGAKIQYLSSYVDKVIRYEQRKAYYNDLLRSTPKKQREVKQSEVIPLYNWLES